MEKIYVYNVGSHCLHIKNFCIQTQNGCSDMEQFETEEDVYAKYGMVWHCDYCTNRKNEMLREHVKELEKQKDK